MWNNYSTRLLKRSINHSPLPPSLLPTTTALSRSIYSHYTEVRRSRASRRARCYLSSREPRMRARETRGDDDILARAAAATALTRGGPWLGTRNFCASRARLMPIYLFRREGNRANEPRAAAAAVRYLASRTAWSSIRRPSRLVRGALRGFLLACDRVALFWVLLSALLRRFYFFVSFGELRFLFFFFIVISVAFVLS